MVGQEEVEEDYEKIRQTVEMLGTTQKQLSGAFKILGPILRKYGVNLKPITIVRKEELCVITGVKLEFSDRESFRYFCMNNFGKDPFEEEEKGDESE